MQVLPDQFIRSLIPCDHKTGAWLSNGRFEKLLCSPVRATSLSTDSCTFVFGFLSEWERSPEMTSESRQNAARRWELRPPFLRGINFGSIVLVVLEDVGEGREVENTCHPDQDEFKDPKSWSTSSNQSTHTRTRSHTMGTRVTWMFWQIDNSKVVIPKLN